MDLAALITVAVTCFSFTVLAFTRYSPDIVLMGAVCLLMVSGVLSPGEALSGFANEGMITVAVLFVVANGLSRTGGASLIAQKLLGRPSTIGLAQMRLMLPVATLSSVVNNTPVVAMMIPAVIDWAKKNNFSVSQLMMPLSYAAIIGGACTLIGTSTNLVVDGMLKNNGINVGLGVFELAWVGVPCVIVTVIYVFFVSPWLLPKRQVNNQQFGDVRKYTVEMLVEPDSVLSGQTIEQAGLRSLPGLYLIEIQRSGFVVPAVAPSEILRAEDRLVFAGNVESVVDLQQIRGLRPAEDQIFKLNSDRSQRHLVEVVISNSFPQLGKTVKEGRFRSIYGAAIIAVARQGQRIQERIGDIVLRPGDTLLIEAPPAFERQQRYASDFLLVRRIEGFTAVSHDKIGTALSIFVAMVAAAAFGLFSMLEAAMLAAGAMLLTRCTRPNDARQSIDWQVLIVIGASIALGYAIEKTGVAKSVSDSLLYFSASTPELALTIFFILTALFSAIISNVAAAVLLFPIAAATSATLGVSMTPFAVTLMIAASASFATPIGYQTNLMVYGPGKYRFSDFLKMGLPLTALVGLTTVLLVPMIWPL